MKRTLRNPFLSFCILSASVHGTVLALLAAPQPRVLVTSPAISVTLAAPPPVHNATPTATGRLKPKPGVTPRPAHGGSGERITPVTALPRPLPPQAVAGLASWDSRETFKDAEAKRTAATETDKPTGSEARDLSQKESERRRRDLARTLVSEALRAHLDYPLLARKHGWQGRVRLRLQIVDNGRITGIHLVQSSGYGILDQAALHSLSQVAKLNPLSRWPLLHDLDIVIPVEYRLLDG